VENGRILKKREKNLRESANPVQGLDRLYSGRETGNTKKRTLRRIRKAKVPEGSDRRGSVASKGKQSFKKHNEKQKKEGGK